MVDSARIWPKPFTKKAGKTNLTMQLWFIGLELSKPGFCMEHYFRVMTSFEETLYNQARPYLTPDMSIEAHFVLKSDLTRHLSATELQEIVSSQSQKLDTPMPLQVPRHSTPVQPGITGGLVTSSEEMTGMTSIPSGVGSHAQPVHTVPPPSVGVTMSLPSPLVRLPPPAAASVNIGKNSLFRTMHEITRRLVV